MWSPEIDANVSSPTQGWNVGGHFLVDVVTAASPDIVSEASPPFKEQRYSGGLDGGYKLGPYGGAGAGQLQLRSRTTSRAAAASRSRRT